MAHVLHAALSRNVASTQAAAVAAIPGTSTDADPLSVMTLKAAVSAAKM